MKNQGPGAPETVANQAPFTLDVAEGVMFAKVDSVEVVEHAQPTVDDEKDGVTSVVCACVSPVGMRSRPEAYTLLSADFKAAMLRIKRRSGNGATTTVLTVTTRIGDPITEGEHTTERSEEVYVLDSGGLAISGHHQSIMENWNNPNAEVLKTVVGNPIVGDDLVSQVATRVRDIQTCVSAGI